MITLTHENVLNTTLKSYFLWKLLGEGSTSRVYLAINQKTKGYVAIKVIPKQYLNSDPKVFELVKTEIYILKNHTNENIVKCFEVFQSPTSIFIVTEYCDSIDLDHYLKSKKSLTEDNAIMFLRQILNGFKGLHQLNMMHRDFKLSNILLTTSKICKIADLGFAKKLQEGSLTESILGTYITMAPEVIKGKPYGLSADIWSIGVVLYQMIFGDYPFNGQNEKLLLKSIQTKKLSFRSVRVSRECQDFIVSCLQEEVEKRITWPEVYKHPLITKKRMEIIYGIFVPKIEYHEMEEFYSQKTKQLKNPQKINLYESLQISRKEVINECIQEKAANGRESFQIFRNSAALDDDKRTQLKCAKKYIMYLNSISHPCKFLTRRCLNTVDSATIFNLQYLQSIFRKVQHELKQYSYILKHKINLFKIKQGWQNFTDGDYYTVVQHLIDQNLRIIEYSKRKLDREPSKKALERISDPQSTEFKQETIRIMKELSKKLRSSKNERASDSILTFLQALFFYLEHQGKTAEQFDMAISKPTMSHQEACKRILQRVEKYINN